MLKKRILISVFACYVLFISNNSIFAQFSATMYHLNGVVPQTHLMNPAIQPMCGFYLGFPGLSPLSLRVSLPLSMNDIIFYDSELDSTILFLHDEKTLGNFIDNLRDKNIFYNEISTDLASWGFRSGDMYFSFDIVNKTNASIIIPGDMLKLIMQGNRDGDVFNFNNFGVNARSYMEYSMGVSKQFSEKLSIGIRGKILFGLVDITSKSSNMQIETGLDEWRFSSDFTANVSVPGLSFYYEDDGTINLDSIDFNDDIFSDNSQIKKTLTGNFGLGLDLGMIYNINDRFSVSASLIDLGRIKWRNSVQTLVQNADYTYSALYLDSVPDDTFFEEFLDTIIDEFSPKLNSDPYVTYLPGKLYLGARYMLTPRISVGALSRTELYKSKLRQQLTFSLNLFPGKLLATSFSYSMQNYSFDNIGFGLSSKLGPFNMYFIMDHIPLVYAPIKESDIPFLPVTMKDINLKLGFNLVFGCNKQKKLMRDKPMLE